MDREQGLSLHNGIDQKREDGLLRAGVAASLCPAKPTFTYGHLPC